MDADTLLSLHALRRRRRRRAGQQRHRRPDDFSTEDGVVRLQSRANFDRGLPLAAPEFESHAMLKDRICGTQEMLFPDPCHQRTALACRACRRAKRTACCAARRTRRDTHQARRDARDPLGGPRPRPPGAHAGGPRFAEPLVRFDNDLISNSIVVPI